MTAADDAAAAKAGAHGAAVDVLDTPKNRRALRDNAEKIQCKGCLMSAQGGSVEKCKEWAAPPWNFGSAFENCEASDKDFVFEVHSPQAGPVFNIPS